MSRTIDEGRPLSVLSEEEQMFFDSVRDYAAAELRPKAAAMDRENHLDASLLPGLFDMGLMGLEIPEHYGGSGGSFFMSILAIEALSQADPGVAVLVDVQNTLVNNALLRWGSDDLKSRTLPRLSKDTVGAYALSEAVSGSDAFSLKTKAEDKGDHYLLNGQKLWITNAGEAGLFIVFASIDFAKGYKGITAFIVERGFEGFSVGKKEDKLGIRASSTCELVLENCRVPKANILGEAGKGYKVAIETLNEGRIGIGAQMLGLAEAALHHALDYTAQRKQFGQALSSFQAVQFQLARCYTDVETARLFVYNAARLKQAGMPYLKEAAAAKLLASEAAERVTSQVINLYGGYGFTKEYPVEKLFRDAKIGQIYEGTSNMQLQTIAKALMTP